MAQHRASVGLWHLLALALFRADTEILLIKHNWPGKQDVFSAEMESVESQAVCHCFLGMMDPCCRWTACRWTWYLDDCIPQLLILYLGQREPRLKPKLPIHLHCPHIGLSSGSSLDPSDFIFRLGACKWPASHQIVETVGIPIPTSLNNRSWQSWV